jgi:hypothetical protein
MSMSVPSGGLALQLHHGDEHRVDLRAEGRQRTWSIDRRHSF